MSDIWTAVIIAVAGGLSYFVGAALKMVADYYLGKIKSALADKAVNYALNVTDGTEPGCPVPAEKVPEVVAAAEAFVQKVAPDKVKSMTDMESRVLARIEVTPPAAP